ncbi:hypothetical protein ACFQZT_17525 [Paenibacillus sp. GCM10027628]|uniref:hypothetical protein n=1 Tax=Paenibacillus sp. GCM10027628 TaxID=3273413 RepID=UPI00362EF822
MDSGSEKKKDHREITYQVGWKKGKIEWNEGGPSSTNIRSEGHEDLPIATFDQRIRLLWRAAPSLPGNLILPVLYALPVICFILSIVLVYNLRHGA